MKTLAPGIAMLLFAAVPAAHGADYIDAAASDPAKLGESLFGDIDDIPICK